MARRNLIWLLIPFLLVLITGSALAHLDIGSTAELNQPALIAVSLRTRADFAGFQRAGLPVYARWPGTDGEIVLSGADDMDLAALRGSGLSVEILDEMLAGQDYYVVYPHPGHDPIPYNDLGQVLYEVPGRVLLKIPAGSVQALVSQGSHLRRVSLEAKPLVSSAVKYQAPALLDPDPDVQDMINQVNLGTVYTYAGNLTGLWPVMIDGSLYTITTRSTFSGEPLEKATRLLGTHMEALGLAVEYHSWNSGYPPNVIGERTGFSQPEDIFIIGAHLDNLPYGPVAPGMDDNASGSIGVLIAADILSQYHWDCTLRFVFWTGEEQGLWGSDAYATRSAGWGENIVAVLNLDMIAWNTLGSDPTIELHANSSITPTLEVAQLFVDVIDAYNLDLDPEIIPNGTDRSDHASFWDWGYTAILGIEDFGGDFNPNYHTTADTYANLPDIPYFIEYIRGAVATYAHLAGCRITDGLGTLAGSVSEVGTGSPIPDATIAVNTAQGYISLTTGSPTGVYSTTLPAGVYTATAQAPGYLPMAIYPVNVLSNTTTTLDIVLEVPETVYFPIVPFHDP